VGVGYLKRPELTAMKFVSHSRWGKCFRTGDMALAAKQGKFFLLLLLIFSEFLHFPSVFISHVAIVLQG
jgi:hypothetical protein